MLLPGKLEVLNSCPDILPRVPAQQQPPSIPGSITLLEGDSASLTLQLLKPTLVLLSHPFLPGHTLSLYLLLTSPGGINAGTVTNKMDVAAS